MGVVIHLERTFLGNRVRRTLLALQEEIKQARVGERTPADMSILDSFGVQHRDLCIRLRRKESTLEDLMKLAEEAENFLAAVSFSIARMESRRQKRK